MQQATKAKLLKYLRSFHGWLGILILPWVLVAGLTGFYLNHARAINALILPPAFDESVFDDWPDPQEGTLTQALKLAAGNWTDEQVKTIEDKPYHNRPAIIVTKPSGQVIVSKPTGHYYIKTWLTRKTYTPDGQLLDRHIYWGSLFKMLHTRGWFSTAPGTWLADITSLALVGFALSGIFLWWMPRAKKIRRALRRT